jgi:hypothetical protein
MMDVEKLVEEVARAIADGLGDNFDHAFVTKSEWNAARGEKGGRYRDINEPRQGDYTDAARSAILATLRGVREADDDLLDGEMRGVLMDDRMTGQGHKRPKAAVIDDMWKAGVDHLIKTVEG